MRCSGRAVLRLSGHGPLQHHRNTADPQLKQKLHTLNSVSHDRLPCLSERDCSRLQAALRARPRGNVRRTSGVALRWIINVEQSVDNLYFLYSQSCVMRTATPVHGRHAYGVRPREIETVTWGTSSMDSDASLHELHETGLRSGSLQTP